MKINRAKTHLQELERECRAFISRNPYSIVCDKDTNAGQLVYKVRILERIPASLSTIIGDVIHNLRSALDLLATELVVSNRGSRKNVYFPFNASRTELETRTIPKRMPGANDKALRFVKRLKPYKGGNEPLWKLHQLNILDKHQTIIPVGSAFTSVDPDLATMSGWPSAFQHVRIAIRPADREYPLKDGTELYRCPIPDADDPEPKPKFTIEIAFGEGQIVDGEPLVPTLKQFVDLVERITDIADRHFFQNATSSI